MSAGARAGGLSIAAALGVLALGLQLGWRPATAPVHDPVRDAELRQERLRAVEQGFQAEAHTPESAGTESELRDWLAADAALRGALRSVSCGAQTCRVELDGAGGELAKGLPLFLHRTGRFLARALVNEVALADGTRQVVLYLSR